MKKLIGKIIAATVGAILIFSITDGAMIKASTPALYMFEPWAGSGTTSVHVNIDSARFIKIVDHEEVNKEAYSITGTDGNTIITLNEEYLKTLNTEEYQDFLAYFSGEGIVTNRCGIVLEKTQPEITISKLNDEKVLRVMYGNEEVDPSHYTIIDNGNKMTISFKEEYAKTVPEDANIFYIELSGNMIVFLGLNFGMKGDADGDSAITVNDAKIALKAALNLVELSRKQFDLLNLDKDSRVTLKDARKILRVALNIESI